MRALKSVLGTPLMREPRQIAYERLTLIEVVARFLTMLRARAEAETSQRFEVALSGKPGLGVDLDYDQVARGEERYSKCPYRKRDDEAEMRKHVDSNWKRILPRW